jgi:hypothetical protein
MEVSNTVAITGIIVSLTIFFLLLRRAVSLQELSQANDDELFAQHTDKCGCENDVTAEECSDAAAHNRQAN